MDGLQRLRFLNLNQLKVFLVVYRTGGMTQAAEELHLTQSGVSQHIRALEDDLGVRLFDRLHRKLIPTPAAQQLQGSLLPAIDTLVDAMEGIMKKEPEISGILRIGLPVDFGSSKVLPVLSELGQVYPDLKFEISLDYASEFNQMILDGTLDFAIVDSFALDPLIEQIPLATEKLFLCGESNYLKSKGKLQWNKDYFESLDYVAYGQSEPVLRQWLAHHLKRKSLDLNVRARVMDVRGVARLIGNGLGVGVLPDHAYENMKRHYRSLTIVEGPKKPLINTIHIAYIKGRSFSRGAQFILDEIKSRCG